MEPITPFDLARATGDHDAIGGMPDADHLPDSGTMMELAGIGFWVAIAIGVIVFLQYLSVRAL